MHDLDRTRLELELDETEEYESAVLPAPGELDEMAELEFAADLLGVRSEAELEEFLGSLFRRAVRGAKQFARSQTGRALGGILKNAARQALPVASRGFTRWASQRLGLELEGLSPEDREFEAARQFVRFAAAAAQRAAAQPAGGQPAQAARAAALEAARGHAPGLVPVFSGGRANGRPSGHPQGHAQGHSQPHRQQHAGRWVRQGRNIILLDV